MTRQRWRAAFEWFCEYVVSPAPIWYFLFVFALVAFVVIDRAL